MSQPPERRRSSRALIASLLVLSGIAAAAGWVLRSGRLPPQATQTWNALVSSAAASLSSLAAPVEPDAGGLPPDSGAPVRRQAGPLSSAQLGAPLVHGTFVTACGAPDDLKIVVDVTVKMGRATHVAVKTRPPNPAVAACIERAARELQWDVSPKTDHVTVTY